ncbi:MAG: transcription termination factor Rho [Thermoleophilaceae bacterium]|nr:transcription termination factor Rho [Thermoleophilaceae bacterium]
MPVLDRKELEESPLSDLHAIASELGIEGYRRLRREDLIDALAGDGGAKPKDKPKPKPRTRTRAKKTEDAPPAADSAAKDDDSDDDSDEPPRRRRARRGRQQRRDADDASASKPDDRADEPEPQPDSDDDAETEVRGGVLDILPNGSGFMRPDAFAHSRDDVYVSPAQIRRCELRAGDQIEGPVRSPRRNERHPSLVRVDQVNGQDAEQPAERLRFEDLTPVFATQALTPPDGLDSAPFGRGSRVAVGGPPGSGITTLLRRIVLGLKAAHEDLDIVVVLAGVRPEEVTEWKRDSAVTVAGGGFDRPMDEQAQAADSAVERGKRAVEAGRHAVVVIDSLDALPPAAARRVFGAARATEEAGSLTVIASTGMAGEPLRQATTRIVLEPGDSSGPAPARLAPASGTLRADLLK